MGPRDWLVLTHVGQAGAIHRLPEAEAKLIAAYATRMGGVVIEGPRELTALDCGLQCVLHGTQNAKRARRMARAANR